MTAYRDQYASIFRGGLGVTLIGVSPDSIEELASWADDAHFPFLFARDADGSVIESFGGEIRDNGMTLERAVVVIDPEGRIHKWMTPFNQVDPMAYEELGAAIAEVAPELEGQDRDGPDARDLREALSALSGDCD